MEQLATGNSLAKLPIKTNCVLAQHKNSREFLWGT
jgi:hypothetical protein